MVENILKDLKHWIGWFISAGFILAVLWLLGFKLNWWQSSLILGTIVAVDYFKHKWRLQ